MSNVAVETDQQQINSATIEGLQVTLQRAMGLDRPMEIDPGNISLVKTELSQKGRFTELVPTYLICRLKDKKGGPIVLNAGENETTLSLSQALKGWGIKVSLSPLVEVPGDNRKGKGLVIKTAKSEVVYGVSAISPEIRVDRKYSKGKSTPASHLFIYAFPPEDELWSPGALVLSSVSLNPDGSLASADQKPVSERKKKPVQQKSGVVTRRRGAKLEPRGSVEVPEEEVQEKEFPEDSKERLAQLLETNPKRAFLLLRDYVAKFEPFSKKIDSLRIAHINGTLVNITDGVDEKTGMQGLTFLFPHFDSRNSGKDKNIRVFLKRFKQEARTPFRLIVHPDGTIEVRSQKIQEEDRLSIEKLLSDPQNFAALFYRLVDEDLDREVRSPDLLKQAEAIIAREEAGRIPPEDEEN